MQEKVFKYARDNRNSFVSDLETYLTIPSVSAQPEHQNDIMHAAKWLNKHLSEIGLSSELLETGSPALRGNPVVYAQSPVQVTDRPTVLIYGHYDVQPPEPVELWSNSPFNPTIRDGMIYARGASDNKGQHLAHIKAAQAYLQAAGMLPVNLKILIEGEEEIGSPHLTQFIEAHQSLLKCDAILISDSSLLSLSQPTLVYALRGLVYFEVEARCATHDLHSGSYGGNVQNPAMALSQILSQLKDTHGRVTVPHFYDDVRVLSTEERDEIARVPIGEAEIRAETGVAAVFGDPAFNVLERMGARPSLEINGIWSGYTGPGSKTVLPATAHAKISCRLVPNQDPHRIYEIVSSTMQKLTPAATTLSFCILNEGSSGTLIDRHAPQMQAAVRAAQATYGNTPIFTLEGGTLPVVNDFQRVLGKPVVLLGFGLPSDNIHAPDERFALACYEKGIEASIRCLAEFAT